YAPAQFALGSAWETGSAGLKVDRKEAKKWYQLAANQKNKDALLALGKIYYSGLDGKVDYTKALSLFEQAEHEGAAKGALWLSWMYYNGLGSPVDCNKARSFYEKGAGLNDQKISKNEYIDHCQSDQRSRESSVDTLPELTIDHYGSFDAGSDERPKICDQSFKINANKITNMSSLRLTLELENNEGITKEYVVPVPPFSLNTLGIDMNNNPINNMQTHIDIPVYEQNLCAFYDLTFKVKSATAMLNGKQHDLLKEGYIQPQDK
ncbi:sel1 repeat family protein, partial [Escherichia coli]|nr:sel1 repeat family protein [Escherichia coli]